MEKWLVSSGLRYPFFSFPVLCLPILFHTSRHTFATMMLTLGADLYTTSKLLGHADVKMTQVYAKIINQKKDDAVNLVNGLFD
ncbi:tyrosine-type recombinase/integrase [Parabacteroides sp. B2-S-102]|uniref:tyrosine-type recombinase/integrase n=1 Tax=Parabacteroides sp. B2-S-102 TaxID=2949657 RepID=UPI0033149A13